MLLQENISKNTTPDDWRYREAATFAFGSILEGPDVAALADLVRMGLDFLLHAMKDSHVEVKNTTAWTLGTCVHFVVAMFLTIQTVHQQHALSSRARASHVCAVCLAG